MLGKGVSRVKKSHQRGKSEAFGHYLHINILLGVTFFGHKAQMVRGAWHDDEQFITKLAKESIMVRVIYIYNALRLVLQ